jgi:hypothetical protein
VHLYPCLNSALDGGRWSTPRRGRITQRKQPPSTHCGGGWMGIGTGPDGCAEFKNLLHIPGFEPQTVQRVRNHGPFEQAYAV